MRASIEDWDRYKRIKLSNRSALKDETRNTCVPQEKIPGEGDEGMLVGKRIVGKVITGNSGMPGNRRILWWLAGNTRSIYMQGDKEKKMCSNPCDFCASRGNMRKDIKCREEKRTFCPQKNKACQSKEFKIKGVVIIALVTSKQIL